VRDARELGLGGKIGIALSLTWVGGFVDAVGYIALYQIFTANMSGNSVHVGMYLGQLDFSQLMRPACAISAYVTGIILTRIAVQVAARRQIQRIASFTLAAEALLLLLFARATPAMRLGELVDLHSPTYFSLVALLAFAMGVQTATLTHIGPLTVYTTFVTGTLTKLAEAFTRALFWSYDRLRGAGRFADMVRLAPQQQDVRETAVLASTWICYLLGAAIGTIIKHRWELRALYLPVAVLIVFVLIDQFRPIDIQEERRQQGGSAF
jgi:uncharacterized membrane protein YoaK (UPF0700 family)